MFRFFVRATKENAPRVFMGIARNQCKQFYNHQKEKTHQTIANTPEILMTPKPQAPR